MASAARSSSKRKKDALTALIAEVAAEEAKRIATEERKAKKAGIVYVKGARQDAKTLKADQLLAIQHATQDPPKCHETDAGCSIMGGMRGGELTLPKLLRLSIVLNNKKSELILLQRKLKIYNTNMRIALTRKKQAELTQQFINTNKMTPDEATRKVDIELPNVEAKLRKVMELLNRSSKDLAINPPSSLSPAVSPSASASAAEEEEEAEAEEYSDVPPRATATVLAAKGKGPVQMGKSLVTAFAQKVGILGGKRKTRKSKTRKTRKSKKSKTRKSKKSKTHKKRVTRRKK
jgi:hypothetical protein